MRERAVAAEAEARQQVDSYIREAASSPADELSKLADLHEKGTITDEEFERMKARLVDVSLAGRRVLITGAARGIGAGTARRLHAARRARRSARARARGARAPSPPTCGGAPWARATSPTATQVDERSRRGRRARRARRRRRQRRGRAQLPLVGGDPAVFERTVAVNSRASTTPCARPARTSPTRGYALAIASLAAAVHLPLLGAYSASKAAVEALGNTLRIELRPSGARVGVAYFAELDTDMTARLRDRGRRAHRPPRRAVHPGRAARGRDRCARARDRAPLPSRGRAAVGRRDAARPDGRAARGRGRDQPRPG